jgi:hypothetical protein
MPALLDPRRQVRSIRGMAVPLFAVLIVVACGQSGAAGSSAASITTPPSASPPAPSATPSPTLAPTASPVAAGSASPAASGPCIDVGQLADTGDSVESQLDAIKTALAAKKVDDARSAAQTAGVGLKSLGDLAGPASPQAKQLFLNAATELAKAVTQFPNGGAMFDQARNDVEQGFVVARAAGCPT